MAPKYFWSCTPEGPHNVQGVTPVIGSGADSPCQGADSPCQGEMSRRDKRGREMARRAREGRVAVLWT